MKHHRYWWGAVVQPVEEQLGRALGKGMLALWLAVPSIKFFPVFAEQRCYGPLLFFLFLFSENLHKLEKSTNKQPFTFSFSYQLLIFRYIRLVSPLHVIFVEPFESCRYPDTFPPITSACLS